MSKACSEDGATKALRFDTGKWTKHLLQYSPVWIWQIASLLSTAQITMNSNFTGCVLTISQVEALVMLLSSFCVYIAFEQEKPAFTIPWLVTSAWNIYHWQTPILQKFYKLLTVTKKLGYVPWVVFGLHAAFHLIRMYTMFCVVWWAFTKYVEKKVEEKKQDDETCIFIQE